MRVSLLTFVAIFAIAGPAEAAWVWPVAGEVITPYRNGNDPYASGQHRGIDIAAPVGAPVVAAAGGEVRFAGTAGSSGLTVSVRTGDGFDTSYLHLSSLAVRAGVNVSVGDRIGAVGTTGARSAAAPHLHLGVRDAGTRHAYHDPLAFLPPPPGSPAPNPPAPAPAPAPEPAPPAAAPAPVPRPESAPRAAPRVAPAPWRAPRSAPEGMRVPHRTPTPGRVLHPPPGVERASDAASTPQPEGRIDEVRNRRGSVPPPSLTPTPSGALNARPMLAARATPEARGQSAPDTGPDIGWALACAGLLLAAGVLAFSDHRPSARARRRAQLARLLPLLGRR